VVYRLLVLPLKYIAIRILRDELDNISKMLSHAVRERDMRKAMCSVSRDSTPN